MSENRIYEITKLMQNPENIKNDMAQVLEIVLKHFKNKYIAPIEQEVRCCSEKCKKAPLREITLLEACRPFVKSTDTLDTIINILGNINVINTLVPSYNVVSAQSLDTSIHNDGIYDVDQECKNSIHAESLLGINPIIIALIIILLT